MVLEQPRKCGSGTAESFPALRSRGSDAGAGRNAPGAALLSPAGPTWPRPFHRPRPFRLAPPPAGGPGAPWRAGSRALAVPGRAASGRREPQADDCRRGWFWLSGRARRTEVRPGGAPGGFSPGRGQECLAAVRSRPAWGRGRSCGLCLQLWAARVRWPGESPGPQGREEASGEAFGRMRVRGYGMPTQDPGVEGMTRSAGLWLRLQSLSFTRPKPRPGPVGGGESPAAVRQLGPGS